MPATYMIDQDAGLVLSRAWGTLTDADLVANRDAMLADPGFRADLSQLWDFTRVDQLEVTGAGVRSLAMGVSPFSAASRRAIIVTDDAGFGMARMFLLMRDSDTGGSFKVFRDRESALSWLAATRS